ncbi:TraR/DksA C4-type zinc finger protein, partial [Alicyclobacillus herbarius]|uniref:TraR/DksA C4-type zinc finger protein n=1 Tax=Alicyclobacillus herbarius TaxID=122960 RepID=UPI0004119BEA
MDWSDIRRQLEEERARIKARFEESGDYGMNAPMGDSLSELSVYDNHPADIGSELFERGKDIALRDRDRIRLQEIDRALEAIATGRYGVCQHCAQPIPRERLQAYPTALLCVDCKHRDEQEHPPLGWPVEEDFLKPAFKRSNFDGTDVVEFDGEDSWQAVARYNERPEYQYDYEMFGLEDNEGIVDPADAISDKQYRDQLP